MITQINNEQDYDEALQRMDDLWTAQPNTPEYDELDKLIELVDAYEQTFFNSVGHKPQGNYQGVPQSSFNFFDPDEATPDEPVDIKDLLNQWDKENDGKEYVKKQCVSKFCNCHSNNPQENWALGKKFFVCNNCKKEINNLSEGEGI